MDGSRLSIKSAVCHKTADTRSGCPFFLRVCLKIFSRCPSLFRAGAVKTLGAVGKVLFAGCGKPAVNRHNLDENGTDDIAVGYLSYNGYC